MMKLAQKLVLAALAMKGAEAIRLEEFTAEELVEINFDLADDYDVNHDDIVTADEFCEEAWEEYGLDSYEDCIKIADTDGDGIVSAEEFVASGLEE